MNRGDFDAALDELHPEVEWISPPEWPDHGDVRGRDAVKQIWLESVEPFEAFEFETLEFIEGEGRTFHSLRLAGTGKGSRAPVEMSWCQVAFVGEDGRAVRLENYFDRDRALEAAGLSEGWLSERPARG